MPSLHKVGCNEEKPPRCFDTTDDRNLTPIGRVAYDFVSCSARVTGESSSNSTVSYRRLNVGEGQVVVDHFFKEVRKSELVLPVSNFLSNVLNMGQEFSPSRNYPLLSLVLFRLALEARGIGEVRSRENLGGWLRAVARNTAL